MVITNQFNDQLPVGLLECCTSIADVRVQILTGDKVLKTGNPPLRKYQQWPEKEERNSKLSCIISKHFLSFSFVHFLLRYFFENSPSQGKGK